LPAGPLQIWGESEVQLGGSKLFFSISLYYSHVARGVHGQLTRDRNARTLKASMFAVHKFSGNGTMRWILLLLFIPRVLVSSFQELNLFSPLSFRSKTQSSTMVQYELWGNTVEIVRNDGYLFGAAIGMLCRPSLSYSVPSIAHRKFPRMPSRTRNAKRN
jgi:hypothetical protein